MIRAWAGTQVPKNRRAAAWPRVTKGGDGDSYENHSSELLWLCRSGRSVLALLAGLCLGLPRPCGGRAAAVDHYYYQDGQATAIAREGALGDDPQANAILLLDALVDWPHRRRAGGWPGLCSTS